MSDSTAATQPANDSSEVKPAHGSPAAQSYPDSLAVQPAHDLPVAQPDYGRPQYSLLTISPRHSLLMIRPRHNLITTRLQYSLLTNHPQLRSLLTTRICFVYLVLLVMLLCIILFLILCHKNKNYCVWQTLPSNIVRFHYAPNWKAIHKHYNGTPTRSNKPCDCYCLQLQ